jgi:predicted nuclease of predicted toxin-antitoxin system
MKLYLDENIPVVLCTALSSHGVDCLTTQQAGNLGLSDVQQLAFATTESRALVTFNCKDFLPLVQQWQESNRTHPGLILFKELPVPELLRRFRRFLHQHQTDDLTNLILWLYP